MRKSNTDPMEVISICLNPHLLKLIDKSRGNVPRSRYIVRILEEATNSEPHEYP